MMTEKNIFVYKVFLSLNISDFSFFFCKNIEIILEIIFLKIKVWGICFDEYSDTGTHWIALYASNNNVTYFDSFGVDHIPKEIEKFITTSHNNKSQQRITTNIYRIQAYDSVMH